MAEVVLRHLTKSFGGVVAVDDVSLKISDGEFLVLLGPSGCGKSTILRLIAGLEDATMGEIAIDDRIVNFTDPTLRNVAMVFQNYALYPHMTVYKNVAFPLETAKLARPAVEEAVQRASKILEIEELLNRLPEQLSGGQRQRVALARAIVREPGVFLMDEPLSSLDAQLRLQTRLELMDLHEHLGITTIYVTHDQVEAMTMGNRMAVMRGGRIQQVGRPTDVYDFPANTFVARFLGAPPMNLLAGDLAYSEGRWWYRREDYELEIDAVAMDIPNEALEDAAGQAWLGLRPEDLGLSPADHDGIPGTIRFLEPVGSNLYVSVEVAGGLPVQVRMPPRSPVKSGDSVRLKFAVTDSHLFAHHQQNLRKAPKPRGDSPLTGA